MKRKFVFFALLAACVSATCSMCGNDSDTPEYEFPDGPEPEPEPDAYPHGLTVTEFADDLADGKRCLGFVATADPKANPKLRFNAVHLPVQKTPTRIHADFDSENRGKPCVTTNAGYWWAGNSLSLLVSGGVVESIENQTVTRDGKTVYPVRASFGQMASGKFETHWIYCVSDDGNRPYAFPSPLDNDERTGTYMPAPPTSKTPGAALWTPQEAVGGGPMLVKEGRNVAEECYWREVFDGGGIAGTSRQPRTAVGATGNCCCWSATDAECAAAKASHSRSWPTNSSRWAQSKRSTSTAAALRRWWDATARCSTGRATRAMPRRSSSAPSPRRSSSPKRTDPSE